MRMGFLRMRWSRSMRRPGSCRTIVNVLFFGIIVVVMLIRECGDVAISSEGQMCGVKGTD
jgi:hypothetical protein